MTFSPCGGPTQEFFTGAFTSGRCTEPDNGLLASSLGFCVFHYCRYQAKRHFVFCANDFVTGTILSCPQTPGPALMEEEEDEERTDNGKNGRIEPFLLTFPSFFIVPSEMLKPVEVSNGGGPLGIHVVPFSARDRRRTKGTWGMALNKLGNFIAIGKPQSGQLNSSNLLHPI
ncbi:hypothetical protein PO909_016644 [Leuciscus waleckii]